MRLNVVVVRERVSETAFKWVAVSLERVVAASGDTPEEALEHLRGSIRGRHEVATELGMAPMDLPPAPQRYWDLFQQAQPGELEAGAEFDVARIVSAA